MLLQYKAQHFCYLIEFNLNKMYFIKYLLTLCEKRNNKNQNSD